MMLLLKSQYQLPAAILSVADVPALQIKGCQCVTGNLFLFAFFTSMVAYEDEFAISYEKSISNLGNSS